MTIRVMLRYLLNFLYPPRCAGCGARFSIAAVDRVCAPCLLGIERLHEPLCARCGMPLEEAQAGGGSICVRCARSLPRFRMARAAARYRAHADDRGGMLASMIRRHKYGLDQSLGRALAECLGTELPMRRGDYDLVIPVPLHRGRLHWRGFNQAGLLAIEVARRLECTLDVTSLTRTRSTAPQTANDLDTRRRNVRRAFAIRRADAVRERRVLLVDDVMTTGATADECARTLLAAGARTVDVFTLARAL
jgi:ComF family protein